MRALVIDEAAKIAAKKVLAFALARRFSVHDLQRIINGTAKPPGDDPNYGCTLFDGWKVVFTVEQHPGGWFYHISISVDMRDSSKPMPNPAGIEEILKMFNIGPISTSKHGWPENGQNFKAINLLFAFTEPVV